MNRNSLIKLFAIIVILASSFLVPAVQTEVAQAVGENWIDPDDGNQTERIKVVITENGGGAKDDYAVMYDALYEGAIINKDSINQFLYRPATRYVGTYDRTYIIEVSSAGVVTIKYWDEDDSTLSAATTLATGFSGEDHDGGNIIVLQNQTGDLASENGTILTAYSNLSTGLYSRRSDNAEDIGSGSATGWGNQVTITLPTGGYQIFYPMLVEIGDGTIFCFYAKSRFSGDWPIFYKVLTVAANPDDDAWGSEVELADLSTMGSYHKTWYDGTDIHFILGALYERGVDATPDDYQDIWYIKYQTSDSTWRTAGGTAKTLPLDLSDADHTPDVVYTSTDDPYHSTVIWDIKTDGSNNPYLLFLDGTDFDLDDTADVLISYYSGGSWNTSDTGINTVRFGTTASYPILSGAEFKEGDVDTIYAAVPDGSSNAQIQAYQNVGGTWYIADGNNGTTAIATDGKITQASPGDNFRPITVLNGAGHFEILWFYSERYGPQVGEWESMRLAYPGFSNGANLCVNKNVQSDFDDLLMTQDDGQTLQPAASNGLPWEQETTEYWRAIRWWKVGDIPAAGGNVTVYIYHSDPNATNANTQAIMDAQFLACDHFSDGTTLDLTKWDVEAGAVTVASDNLVLTGVGSGNGLIDQDTANYALFTYGEMRVKWYGSDASPGDAYHLGLALHNDASDAAVLTPTAATNDRVDFWSLNEGSYTTTNHTSQEVATAHIYAIRWKSGSVAYYNDVLCQTSKTLDHLASTHTTNTPNEPMGMRFLEGSAGVVYVPWAFTRPWTDPEPTVSALSQQSQLLITTLSATSVHSTSATLNGNVAGAASTQYIAFWWGDDCATLPTSMAIGDWDNYYSEAGVYETGETFSYIISSLDPERCYWFVAGGNSTSGDFDCGECIWFCTSSADSDFGIVAVNTEYTTGVTQFFWKNCGNETGNVTISSSVYMVGSGGNWTVSTDATNGADIVGIKAGVDDDDDTYDVIVKPAGSTPYNLLKGSLAASGNFTFGIWMLTPTSNSDGSEKMLTITTWFEETG